MPVQRRLRHANQERTPDTVGSENGNVAVGGPIADLHRTIELRLSTVEGLPGISATSLVEQAIAAFSRTMGPVLLSGTTFTFMYYAYRYLWA